MGTTLTGTTPANTYDSLIKVTDNGPLSGTAKYLSDGLGNDSVLALSTSLVGVNTNTPSNFLQVTDPNSSVGGAQLTLEGRATGYGAGVIFASRVDNSSGALVPMAKITGDGEDSWTSTASTQDAGMRLYTATDGSLTEKMRITSAGNVGIGDPSPSWVLDVNNTSSRARFKANTGDSSIELSSIAGRDWLISSKTDGAFSIYDEDASSERMRITSAGNVGIGTSGAVLRLDVKGAAANTTTVGGVTVEETTLFRPSNDAGGMRFGFDASSNAYLWSAASGASLRLGTRLAPDNNVNMTLLANGNVGIGTASPAVPLHACSPSLNSDIAVFTSSGNTSRGLKISTFNSGNNDAGVILNAQTSLGAIAFQATGTEIARITSNGLTFNGDTAAANALDDYEEGTWTPVLRGSGTAGTYETSVLFAHYTKIGNKVSASMRMTLDSTITGGGSGYALLTGLPFAKSASQQAIGASTFSQVTFSASAVQVVTQFQTSVGASSNLYFPQVISGGSYVDTPISAFTGNQNIEFSITYFV